MPSRPSSSVNFPLKSLISQKLSNHFSNLTERFYGMNVGPPRIDRRAPQAPQKWPPWLYLDILPNFGMELPNDGTNELSKDGFDGVALKVIFQGWKGQIGPF